MKIIYSSKHKVHNPTFEIYDGEKSTYPEVSERIETIKSSLLMNNLGEVVNTKSFPTKYIDAIHLKNYRVFLEEKSSKLSDNSNFFTSYFMTDTYAPITNGTYKASKKAVDVALTGASLLLSGEKLVYSLCRPPGHHAGYVHMGGYCYFNNAAIAAEFLSKKGKVAILDIDYHHGNGTQEAFYDRNDVLYVSLHVDPNFTYPYIAGFKSETGRGKGEGFNKNYPLSIKTSENVYKKALQKALQDIRRFMPKYLVISAGFDTYIKDPIGSFKLTTPFYREIGKEITKVQLPMLVIQEGGYYVEDLGKIAVSFVRGLQNV